MRVDSNTRGHHQWFYFKVSNQQRTGTIKFNVVNFTKHKSLYMQGMRINVKSKTEYDERLNKQTGLKPTTENNARAKKAAAVEPKVDPEQNDGWEKAGENISYKLSKLSIPQIDADGYRKKRYFQMSFEYTFKHKDDEVWFAYSVPYTVSKLHNLLKTICESHTETIPS